jgi:hypothetical protein
MPDSFVVKWVAAKDAAACSTAGAWCSLAATGEEVVVADPQALRPVAHAIAPSVRAARRNLPTGGDELAVRSTAVLS